MSFSLIDSPLTRLSHEQIEQIGREFDDPR